MTRFKSVYMDLSTSLVCPCNGKAYKSNATMKAHRQSHIHLVWEMPKTIRDLEIRATKLENENDHLKRVNILLTDQLKIYEKKLS